MDKDGNVLSIWRPICTHWPARLIVFIQNSDLLSSLCVPQLHKLGIMKWLTTYHYLVGRGRHDFLSVWRMGYVGYMAIFHFEISWGLITTRIQGTLFNSVCCFSASQRLSVLSKDITVLSSNQRMLEIPMCPSNLCVFSPVSGF